jgi:hypothetical protein
MRNRITIILLSSIAIVFLTTGVIYSQDEKPSPFSAGADIYSSYVWRGTKYGSGPSVQPSVKFSSKYFSAGAWGSFDFNGYQEADLWFSFTLPAGISLGMTDYYYPDLDYTDISDTTGSHGYEVNLGFSKWGLSLSGNYMLNKAGGAGTKGGDLYFEAKYSFKALYLFAGAGNGWHTTDNADGSDRFRFCNIGAGVTKEIKVTDNFSIPVNGQVIFNPDRKKMYIMAGFSL